MWWIKWQTRKEARCKLKKQDVRTAKLLRLNKHSPAQPWSHSVFCNSFSPSLSPPLSCFFVFWVCVQVCYSWWVLSSLSILGKIKWIDREALGNFILECQDTEKGGVSDRPNNMVDVFHTYFGIAGLSLLGYPTLNQIDPVYALPVRVVKKLKLHTIYSTS